MNDKIITVDVRDEIRDGREPFSKIMNAASALRAEERLLLIAPFEPVPLFGVLAKQGFVHKGQTTASGDWEILFTRQPAARPVAAAQAGAAICPHNGAGAEPALIVEVDARGFEPPQPMVRILETLATVPTGAQLSARTDRRPIHLYAQLEERGFNVVTEEQPDGSFLSHIRR